VLGLSTRQTRRLLTTYRDGGGGALIHDPTSIKINSCPGYVKTEMSKGGGFLTVEEGARASVR
jgi:hypothetical protein